MGGGGNRQGKDLDFVFGKEVEEPKVSWDVGEGPMGYSANRRMNSMEGWVFGASTSGGLFRTVGFGASTNGGLFGSDGGGASAKRGLFGSDDFRASTNGGLFGSDGLGASTNGGLFGSDGFGASTNGGLFGSDGLGASTNGGLFGSDGFGASAKGGLFGSDGFTFGQRDEGMEGSQEAERAGTRKSGNKKEREGGSGDCQV